MSIRLTISTCPSSWTRRRAAGSRSPLPRPSRSRSISTRSGSDFGSHAAYLKFVNAFCTPGGYIYVYTGLLKFIDDEATLAGVMGHEIAHAEQRHASKRMTKAYGAQIVLSLVLGENPGQLAEISANLFTGLALLANSRSDESEADEFSMKYLTSTPYYPGAITHFFQKMQGKKGGNGGGAFERLLSTHPLDQDRIDHVTLLLRQMGNPKQSEGNIFAQKYQAFKKKLP